MKKIYLIAGLLLAAHTWAQECDPVDGPYVLDVESAAVPALPDCLTSVPGSNGNAWTTANAPGNGFDSKTLTYFSGTSAADAWIFTQGIQITAGTYYRVSYTYGNADAVQNFSIKFGNAPTAAAMTSDFANHIANTLTPSTPIINMFNLPDSGVYYFGIQATSAGNGGTLMIDDFSIVPMVCGAPVNVTVDNVGQNTATLSWSAPTGGNMDNISVYQYAYSETNTPPADGNYFPGTTINLIELDPATTYYAFTRTLCGPVWSEWTEGVAFTTGPCPTVPAPYTMDFESVPAPNLPGCTIVPDPATGSDWVTVNNPGNGFESNTLAYVGNAEAGGAWLFTQGVDIEPGVFYRVSYRYGNNSATTTEKLRVTLGTSPNPASVQGSFGEHTNITGGEAQTHGIDFFNVTEAGTYYFGFNAFSDASQGTLYVDDFVIAPLECGVPSTITVSNVSHNSATLNWAAPTTGNSGTVSVYQYAVVTSDTPPADGTYNPGTTASVADLEPGTLYHVFMRTQCGPVMSDWTEAITFRTAPCEAADAPYTLDFESATVPGMADCTTLQDAGNNWVTVNNPGHGFDSKALHYDGNDGAANAWLFTRGINLAAGTFYKVSYKYGNDSTTQTEKLKVTFGNSPNAEPAPNTFADHEITGGEPGTSEVEFFNVPTSGTYYFGFNAHSDSGQGSLYVDDFVIEEMDCGVPSGMTVTNVTHNSAVLGWAAPTTGNSGTISVYQYAVVTTDAPPAEGTFNPGMSVNLEDLDANTTYYVFMRTQCGPIWSGWTESLAFTTAGCEAANVPYTLDFESAAVPAMPDCTTLHTADTGNDWVTVNNPGNGFTSKTLHYEGTAEAANAWLFTQGINLATGTYYKVSYKYGNDSTTQTEKLRVTLGNSPNAMPVPANFAEHTAITGGEPVNHAVEFFNVGSSGIYYFGFNAFSESGNGSLYVDDFLIEEMECGTPSNVTVSDVTDTTATVNWQAPTTGNSTTISVYQYAYSTENTPPAEGTFEPGLTADLDELTPETTYYVFTRTQCGPIWSDWTVTEFTTGETLGTANNTFAGLKVYPNPVKDIVTVTGSTAIDAVEIYNITGQLVHRQGINGQTADISMQKLAAGAYFLNIYANGEVKRVKLIKE